ncbi:MAG: LysR family transcriptional regulator [Telmatospirillum sp.]|nr:LysR family transcriptional regulator [Telmatospirillum sp.]
MDTEAVAVLLAAASTGSLSAAARRLGITPMAATRRLSALEADLGVRLLQRTTRSLSLTPEGEAFLPFAETLVEGAAAGRAILKSASEGASGLLRVSVPVAFGRKVVAPLIPDLLRDHADLRIDLDMTDRLVDLVSGGIDVAIRIARLRDSSLVARRLAGSPRLLCASPAYLRARGTPRTLAGLAGHDCLARAGVTHWVFRVDGRDRPVRVSGRFAASSVEGIEEVCVRGGGIALLAGWNIQSALEDGRLVAIHLEDAVAQELSIWAVYPTSRQILPKVRVFVARLEACLARMPSTQAVFSQGAQLP